MKKLLFLVFTVLCFSSCEEGFNGQKVESTSQVPIAYSDSTSWKKAKVYIVDNNRMYVKVNNEVYHVFSNNVPNTLIIIVLIMIALLIIGIIIL